MMSLCQLAEFPSPKPPALNRRQWQGNRHRERKWLAFTHALFFSKHPKERQRGEKKHSHAQIAGVDRCILNREEANAPDLDYPVQGERALSRIKTKKLN